MADSSPARRPTSLPDSKLVSMPALRKLWPFLLWLLVFYSVWLTIVISGDYWGSIVEHWGIAVAMAFGSYVAGSTPMGGGTVGFPVLVLLFDLPGNLGRNFGLAVQSIGMTSASIYILSKRQTLHWGLLKPALLGSLLGTPLGAIAIAPFVPDLWIKLTFAIVWASFGIMHLLKMNELIAHNHENPTWQTWNGPIGGLVGITGGIVSSITGVGIDMLLYATMVLLYQADLKVSIPTSVLIMAFTSVIGIVTNNLLSVTGLECYQVDREVFLNWLAAAPIVALGAPFGALVVNLISRKPTLILVSALCVIQYLWTVIHEKVQGTSLLISIVGVLLLSGVFHLLYHFGRGENIWGQPKH